MQRARRAVEFGGQLIEESDVGAALFVRDPDGQLIELLPVAYRDRPPTEALIGLGRREPPPRTNGLSTLVRWQSTADRAADGAGPSTRRAIP